MLPLYSTHSVNQLMTNCKSSNTTAGKAPVRPSSPRQFFARLYGHLEPGNNETESPGGVLSKVKSLNMSANDDNNNKSLPSTSHNNNNNDVNYQSDGSSTSSSDLYISDKRVDGSYQSHNVLSDKTQEVPRDESNNIMCSSTYVGLPFSFSNDASLPTGLTAFSFDFSSSIFCLRYLNSMAKNAFKFGSSILLKTISRALSELPLSNFTKV
uniref:Uncharacterized protein n=1 Tax=Glossina palpalis gambiensis TaxID=67801 RepID=A0A1B0BUM8_9MUSC